MRQDWTHLEKYRIRTGQMRSPVGMTAGAFFIQLGEEVIMRVIAHDGDGEEHGWEHVSVTVIDREKISHGPGEEITRMPTWDEMCKAKFLFWEDTETVLQFHPCKAAYVNHHPNCLHLWKQRGKSYELPPKELIA